MELHSLWPYFVAMALLLWVFNLSWFARLDAPVHPALGPRFSPLDGLRGVLALSVYFHHLAQWRHYLNFGRWDAPPERFYESIGIAGVAFFFMITGYLFGAKVRKQGLALDWRALYIGRAFRIGPVYLLAIGVMLLLVFSSTGLTLHDTRWHLAGTLVQWLALGLARYPDVNGFRETWLLLCGVTWSLRWEWLFYFCLPVLALAHGRRWQTAACGLGALAALCLAHAHLFAGYACLFLIGVLSAYVQSALFAKLPDWLRSLLALACVAAVLDAPDVMQPVPLLLMGLAFYCVSAGCTMFGLLTTRGAVRLGNISYGVYMLHGLVLWSLLIWMPWTRVLAAQSVPGYWAVGWLGAALICLIAAWAHLAIELPGIAAGKWLASRKQHRAPAVTLQRSGA